MGATDCTHIAHPQEELQVYHHHFYSRNVQACDHQDILKDLMEKFLGSIHDAQISAASGLNHLLTAWLESKGWHLGDQGYLLLPYLLITYPEDDPPDCADYNHAH
ncbi:UNVERIFIED_CONTAM: hypothetical protein K2H54_047460 [Gekko kuhli]